MAIDNKLQQMGWQNIHTRYEDMETYKTTGWLLVACWLYQYVSYYASNDFAIITFPDCNGGHALIFHILGRLPSAAWSGIRYIS